MSQHETPARTRGARNFIAPVRTLLTPGTAGESPPPPPLRNAEAAFRPDPWLAGLLATSPPRPSLWPPAVLVPLSEDSCDLSGLPAASPAA